MQTRLIREKKEEKMTKKAWSISLATTLLTACFLLAGFTASKASAAAAAPAWWKGSVQEYNQLVENAKKEGKLTWYDSLDDKASNMVIEEFQKSFPFIAFDHTRARGVESREVILRELQAQVSNIDIIESSEELITSFQELKLLKAYDWGKQFRTDPIQISKDKTMVKVGGSLHGWAYNIDKLPAKDLPKTWEDLLDPKWKNKKIGMDDRPKCFIAMVPAWGEQKTIDYLKKLSKQDIIYKTGTTAGIQMLAAGEFAIYPTATFDSYNKVKSKGANIAWFTPTPAGVSFEAEGVTAKAAHPNAAILFLGWMCSANGGSAIRDKASNGEGIPLPGFNTMAAKQVKNKNQLSVFSEEWLPRKAELHRKLSEALGFKI
jgi:iron(III) transport system substrate-binding protein